MSKMKLNIWIDLLLLLCFSLVVGIGFLIKYVLISGQEIWAKYGTQLHLEFLGMDRHEWGNIHLICGAIMIVLLVLHVVYHWNLIKSMFAKFMGLSGGALAGISVFLLICLSFILLPFFINPQVSEQARGNKHYQIEKRMHKHRSQVK